MTILIRTAKGHTYANTWEQAEQTAIDALEGMRLAGYPSGLLWAQLKDCDTLAWRVITAIENVNNAENYINTNLLKWNN